MNKRTVGKGKVIFALIVVVMLFITACSQPAANPTTSGSTAAGQSVSTVKTEKPSTSTALPACVAGDKIKIGISIARTGNSAEVGQNEYNCLLMALEEVNKAGGIMGKQVELVYEDSQNDAKQAVEIAKKFIADNTILATLTGDSSTCNIACANYYEEAKMCLLAGNASNAKLPPMGDYIFSVAGRSTDESPFSIKGVLKGYLGAQKLAIIYANDDWGVGLYNVDVGLCKNENMEIVSAEQFNVGETDFSSVLSKIRKQSPDAVLVIAQYAEGGLIVNQIRKMGWDIPISVTGAVVNDDFLKLVGKDAEGICGYATLTFSDEFPASMKFYNEYKSRYNRTPTIHATCYEGLKILALAANNCGANLNRITLRDQLAIIKNFEGLNGPVSIDEDGSVTRLWQVVQVKNGVWTKVKK